MKKLFFLTATMMMAVIFFSCSSTLDNAPSDDSVNDDGTEIYFLGNDDPPDDYVPCVGPYETTLIATDEGDIFGRRGERLGTVAITNDNENLYITYKLFPDYASSGWYLTRVNTQLWTGGVGKYRRSESQTFADKSTTDYTLVIPKECDDCDGMLPMFYEIDCGSEIKLMNYASICNDGEGPLGGGNGNFIDQLLLDVKLIAGQNYHIGSVVVEIENGNLVITYNTNGGWFMTNVKFHFADNFDDIPTNGPGKPKIGNFDYNFDLEDKAYFSYSIPISELNFDLDCEDILYVAAHADVHKFQQEETAWGEGPEFTDDGWAMYMVAPEAVECGGLTQPRCADAFGYSDYRACHILGIYPERYYYWVSAGYIFCCDNP